MHNTCLFRLALLWFHTIVRPFFGLDGSNVRSGADAAQRLIDSSKGDFSDAALFLFFQGRVDRLKVCVLLYHILIYFSFQYHCQQIFITISAFDFTNFVKRVFQ